MSFLVNPYQYASGTNAVTFDGTNDYLTHGTALLGNSKEITGSFWFRMNSLSQSWFFSCYDSDFSGDTVRFDCFFDSASGPLRFRGRNSSGTEILNIFSGTNISDNDWHHCAFSFDMSDTAKRHIYVDGVSDIGTIFNYTNDTLNLADANNSYVGTARTLGGTIFNGDLAEFWLASGDYTDLSSTITNFIASSAPVGLGSDGSTPTGTQPQIFLSGATDTWPTNDGSGGGFTENGELTTASTQPRL